MINISSKDNTSLALFSSASCNNFNLTGYNPFSGKCKFTAVGIAIQISILIVEKSIFTKITANSKSMRKLKNNKV